MSAESRRQRRELRRLNKKERKEAFEKIKTILEGIPNLDLQEKLPYKERFNKFWPLLKASLELAILMKYTGEKFDLSAQKLIVIGDSMYGKELTDEKALDFLHQLTSYWETIEIILEILKVVASDKLDEVIDKVIEIGEWIFE